MVTICLFVSRYYPSLFTILLAIYGFHSAKWIRFLGLFANQSNFQYFIEKSGQLPRLAMVLRPEQMIVGRHNTWRVRGSGYFKYSQVSLNWAFKMWLSSDAEHFLCNATSHESVVIGAFCPSTFSFSCKNIAMRIDIRLKTKLLLFEATAKAKTFVQHVIFKLFDGY